MNTAKRIIKVLNTFVDLVVILVLLLAGLYSIYALWDNNRIYIAVENVQTEMQKLKPQPDSDQQSSSYSFEQLQKINPDVCAWLTLDNTKIDYPVLHGTDNLSYINTDVYGNFALAGSIFLDSRNSENFQDAYSLLYGHHMENGKMFGDLDLYKEDSFFSDNSTGMLILPDRAYHLEVFACLLVSASEKLIFELQQYADVLELNAQLLSFVEDNSLHYRSDVIDSIHVSETYPQILAMSTCSTDFTDARTIVLAIMKPC